MCRSLYSRPISDEIYVRSKLQKKITFMLSLTQLQSEKNIFNDLLTSTVIPCSLQNMDTKAEANETIKLFHSVDSPEI